MSKYQVTFKGQIFDITVSGDTAKEIVEDYRIISKEVGRILGVKSANRLAKELEPTASKREVMPRGLPSKIMEFVEEGFFDSPKKLQEIQEVLRKKGITKPVTTLSARLTELVQRQLLERDFELVGNKKVWVYRRRKATGS